MEDDPGGSRVEPSKKRRSVSESESSRLNSTVIPADMNQTKTTDNPENLVRPESTSHLAIFKKLR